VKASVNYVADHNAQQHLHFSSTLLGTRDNLWISVGLWVWHGSIRLYRDVDKYFIDEIMQ